MLKYFNRWSKTKNSAVYVKWNAGNSASHAASVERKTANIFVQGSYFVKGSLNINVNKVSLLQMRSHVLSFLFCFHLKLWGHITCQMRCINWRFVFSSGWKRSKVAQIPILIPLSTNPYSFIIIQTNMYSSTMEDT